MGATIFCNKATGKTAGEAYNILYDEAVYEYGHDPYNGTISTCDMGRCTLSFPTYESKNEEKALKHIEANDWGEKWVADYVDLGYDKKYKKHHYIFYGWAAE